MVQERLKELWANKLIKYPILIVGGLILFTVVSCGIAWLINYVILQPTRFEIVVSDNKTGALWLGFWATFLGAIASFAMVFITWRTLVQNRKQLDELKRQWDETHKIELIASIILSNNHYHLCIHNISGVVARNIICTLNGESFFERFQDEWRKIVEAHGSRPFTLIPNEKKLYYLLPNVWSYPSYRVEIYNKTFAVADLQVQFGDLFNQPLQININCGEYNFSETLYLRDAKTE